MMFSIKTIRQKVNRKIDFMLSLKCGWKLNAALCTESIENITQFTVILKKGHKNFVMTVMN